MATMWFSRAASPAVIERSTSVAQCFAGVFVDDGEDLDRSAVGGEPNWKSIAHTTLAEVVGTGGTVEDPTRLRRRRTCTRSPSRHSRWSFLWFTTQPWPRASW